MDSFKKILIDSFEDFLVDHDRPGVTKKHQRFIFEYWVFSLKSYLNMGRFENNIFAYPKI